MEYICVHPCVSRCCSHLLTLAKPYSTLRDAFACASLPHLNASQYPALACWLSCLPLLSSSSSINQVKTISFYCWKLPLHSWLRYKMYPPDVFGHTVGSSSWIYNLFSQLSEPFKFPSSRKHIWDYFCISYYICPSKAAEWTPLDPCSEKTTFDGMGHGKQPGWRYDKAGSKTTDQYRTVCSFS